jgi:flagellar export protein FliJ
MARFVFRAEVALTYRRQQEQAATRAWREAVGAFEGARRAELDAEQVVATALSDAQAVHDPAHRAWHRNWIVRLRQQQVQLRSRTADLQAVVDAAAVRVNAARRDVKALERLRARALADWQVVQRREEQKEMDWLGSVKYALRMNEPGDR